MRSVPPAARSCASRSDFSSAQEAAIGPKRGAKSLPLALGLLLLLSFNTGSRCALASEEGSFQFEFEFIREQGGAGLIDESWGWETGLSLELGLAGALTLGVDTTWSDERHEIKLYRTKSARQLQLALAALVEEAELEWEFEHQACRYPHASYKSWQADKLALELDLPGWSLELARREKSYPHKLSKDLTTERVKIALKPSDSGGSQAGGASLELERDVYPNAPIKDNSTIAITLSLERQLSLSESEQDPPLSGAVELELDITMTRYPRNPMKDALKRGWSLTGELGLDALEIALTVETGRATSDLKDRGWAGWELGLDGGDWSYTAEHERKSTLYPQDPAKDRLTRTSQRELKLERGELTVVGKAVRERVSYPQNALKDRKTRTYQVELELDGTAVQLSWKTTRYPNDPDKDKRIREAKLKLARELAPTTGAGWTLEAKLEQESYPSEPSKDRLTAGWSVEVELELGW